MRAQRGDKGAYALLASEIADRFLGIARRILRDLDLAEDATQQALLAIWQDLPRLRDPGRFEAWSYRLLVHAYYAEGRKERWVENIVPDVIWHDDSEGRLGFHLVDNLYVSPCDESGFREPPVGPTVDDLVSALTNLPGIDAEPPTDLTLGGHRGKLVTISVPASGGPCGADTQAELWRHGATGATLDNGAVIRFWILDVDGTRLIVSATVRDALPTDLRNELQHIIESIQIESS